MNSLFSARPGYGDLSGPNANHDQRRTPRVVVSADVSVCGDPGHATERGRLINLSTDGALVLMSNLPGTLETGRLGRANGPRIAIHHKWAT